MTINKTISALAFSGVLAASVSSSMADDALLRGAQDVTGGGATRAVMDEGPAQNRQQLFERMTDFQEYVQGKQLELLRARQTGALPDMGIKFGAGFTGTYVYERTNTDGKFPILSRLPGQHSGSSGSDWIVNDAAWGAAVTAGDWLTGYAQLEYIDTRYANEEDIQLRKAFGVVGNLDRFPLYAYFGRNTIDFGDTTTYNPFTHNMNTHFFWALSDDPVLGIGAVYDGWHVVGTIIPEGRHQRVASKEGDDFFGNYAVNVTKAVDFGNGVRLKGGVGYLHSTIYDTVVPHHTPSGIAGQNQSENGAVNANATLGWGPVDVMAEYTTTLDDWPATGKPVEALTVQGRYKDSILSYPTTYSAVYSRGDFGPSGSEFEFMEQMVLGLETHIDENFSVGVEYVRNHGFAPLINIQMTSDQSVETDTFVAGIHVYF
ncbi:hypothetical protein ACSHT0_04170 [Tepidicaulis sp. LMO-SS28]|uniref:hypothetical protein n=1 Tax=Tepidicaulis sp. LMO-SS28 TaxID=3447455 RepID=UPI003EDED9E7